MYQLPHLSLATNGSPYVEATSETKSASCLIERSRFGIDKVLLLSSPRTLLKELLVVLLKMMSASWGYAWLPEVVLTSLSWFAMVGFKGLSLVYRCEV